MIPGVCLISLAPSALISVKYAGKLGEYSANGRPEVVGGTAVDQSEWQIVNW